MKYLSAIFAVTVLTVVPTVSHAQQALGRVYLTSQVIDHPDWQLKPADVEDPLPPTKVMPRTTVTPPPYRTPPLSQFPTPIGCATDTAGCAVEPGFSVGGPEGCDPGCGAGCADEGCSSCPLTCNPCCVDQHCSKIFGEFLLLSAGNVDFRYAQPVDGPTGTAVPIGRGGLVQPEHSPGFRVGFAKALDCDTSVIGTYTSFQSSASSALNLAGGTGFVRSLTTHPNTERVDTDSLNASAVYDIDFRNVDVDYQKLLHGDCCTAVNGRIGLRYGNLSEDFRGDYIIDGATQVLSEIDFNGVGPRMGLDLTKRLGNSSFSFYGNGALSVLLGDFSADFRQTNVFDGLQAADGYDDYRILPVLDFELGLRHISQSGKFSFGAGYLVSAWFNTMTTPGFIDSVHRSDFDEVSETMIFDGLTARAEFRF